MKFTRFNIYHVIKIITVIEIFIIVLLVWNVLSKIVSMSTGSKKSYIQLDKEKMMFGLSSNLNHFYVFSPSQKVNQGAFWTDKIATYTINSDGLNDRYDYSIEKDEGTFRIVTLGDSFTMGAFVNTHENWTERLEDALKTTYNECTNPNNIEVINLGVEGYDLEFETEIYAKKGYKYDPDLLIWFLRDNDFTDFNELTLANFFENHEDRSWYTKTDGRYEKEVNHLWKKSYQKMIQKFGYDKVIEHQSLILEKFGSTYSSKILIFTDNTTPEVFKNILTGFTSRRIGSELITIGDYDIYPDTHPNVQGHQQISEDLLKHIVKSNYILCHK